MSIDEYQQILADLVFRKAITFQEAQELLRRFVAGEFGTQDLPSPLVEATREEDNRNGVLILLAALGLGLVRSKRNRVRDRLRIAARETLRANFEQIVIDLLQAGDIRSWHEGMARLIRNYNVANWMAGNGQFDTPDLGQRIERQLQYLYRFASERHATEALERPHSAEYLANRGTQYRGSAYAAWFIGNESVGQGDGWVSEYVARDDNRTCSPCASVQGFYLPGTGPYPGDVCLGGGACRCERRLVYNLEAYRQLQRVGYTY